MTLIKCIIEAGCVVGTTPQKISVVYLFICCSTPEAIVCLVFELSESKIQSKGVLGVTTEGMGRLILPSVK